MAEALISIKPRYVGEILAGTKTVELRRRTMNLPNNCKLWIYATLPVGSIVAIATVEKIETMAPYKIWENYKDDIRLNKNEFETYVKGCKKASAILITDVKELGRPISLDELREAYPKFSPPQFYMHIKESTPLHVQLGTQIMPA